MRYRMVVKLGDVAELVGMAFAVAAEHQDNGQHHGENRIPDRRAHPALPGRRDTFHGKSVGTRRAIVALPR